MRLKIHVVPRKRGRWAVKKENSSRASKTFDSKKKAVNYGRKKAKRKAGRNSKSELLIHKRNGRIHDKRSYGRDPGRYKG